MKVPRDVNADDFIKLLVRYGYVVIRQSGSHIRLSKQTSKGEHVITVPNHNTIKIGTLQSIVKDVCNVNMLDIQSLYSQL